MRLLPLFFIAFLSLEILATGAATKGDTMSVRDTAFLRELEQKAVLFFLEHTHPKTGLTRDRAPALGTAGYAPASIAASGFALSAWVIGVQEGWMTPEDGKAKTRLTLKFLRDKAEHERGWFYHFLDMETGRRVWKCEASTIDTALFLMGALTAREYWKDPEIDDLVTSLYRRIEWAWALNGGTTLSHGWTPEEGFLPYRWDQYSELMGLYLLGLGAAENSLPPEAWHAWTRGPRQRWNDFDFIACPPLFTHQYSHAWFSFRGQRDAYADYWANSVAATLAQRAWSLEQRSLFPSWGENLWGLTAADGEHGYRAWGAPPDAHTPRPDGTLVPCAPAGSLPFAPRECLDALHAMRALEVEGLWGRYGFADAFNLETGWVSPDVIGIDVGITLLMSQNLRTGSVWELFMSAPEAQRGMARAGFRPSEGGALAAAE